MGTGRYRVGRRRRGTDVEAKACQVDGSRRHARYSVPGATRWETILAMLKRGSRSWMRRCSLFIVGKVEVG